MKLSQPKIGAERWLLEHIDTADVVALAKRQGWQGSPEDLEGIRESCEPEDATTVTEHASLEAATTAAREYLAKGTSFFGCAVIECQRLEEARDDLGRRVKMPPSWERQKVYEVAADGERIEVEG